MDYSKLSDFEINKAVAESLGVKFTQDGLEIYVDVFDEQHGDFFPESLNYCNNPSDAWPIIVENKIDLEFEYDGSCFARGFCFKSLKTIGANKEKNPLRAAMIVYLMMKEGE